VHTLGKKAKEKSLQNSRESMPSMTDDDGFFAAVNTTKPSSSLRLMGNSTEQKRRVSSRSRGGNADISAGEGKGTVTPGSSSTPSTTRRSGSRKSSGNSSPTTPAKDVRTMARASQQDRNSNSPRPRTSSTHDRRKLVTRESDDDDIDDNDDGASCSNGSRNDEEDIPTSSHQRTPSGHRQASRRLNTAGVGRLSITNSPETPTNETGGMTTGGGKPPPSTRRKIKYQPTRPSSNPKSGQPTMANEDGEDGRRVHSDLSSRTSDHLHDDGIFQVTTPTPSKVTPWVMRQRMQREFPGKPIPADTTIRNVNSREKQMTEADRVEQYKADFPGEPIPSDEVLKRLYATPYVVEVSVGGTTKKVNPPSFQHSLKRLSGRPERMSSSSTHSGMTWTTPDFSNDFNSLPSSSNERDRSTSSHMKRLSASQDRGKEPLFHDSMDSLAMSVVESIHKPPSSSLLNSTGFASFEKPSSSRSSQGFHFSTDSIDSGGFLTEEVVEKRSKSPGGSPRGGKNRPRRREERDRTSEHTDKPHEKSADRTRRSDQFDKRREKTTERTKKSDPVDKHRERSPERTRRLDKPPSSKKLFGERPVDPTPVANESRSLRGSRSMGDFPAWQMREQWKSTGRTNAAPTTPRTPRNGTGELRTRPPEDKQKRSSKSKSKSFDNYMNGDASFSGDLFGSATPKSKQASASSFQFDGELQQSFLGNPFSTMSPSTTNPSFEAFGVPKTPFISDTFGVTTKPSVSDAFGGFAQTPSVSDAFGGFPLMPSVPCAFGVVRTPNGSGHERFDAFGIQQPSSSSSDLDGNRNHQQTIQYSSADVKTNRQSDRVPPPRSSSGEVPRRSAFRTRSGLTTRPSADNQFAIEAPKTPGMLRPPKRDSKSKQSDRLMQNMPLDFSVDLSGTALNKEDFSVDLSGTALNKEENHDEDSDGVSIHLNNNEAPLSPITLATKMGPARPARRRGRH